MKHTPILSSMLLLTGAILLSGCSLNAASSSAAATNQSQCIHCHQKNTPGLVRDHLSGKMGQAGVDCAACHGSEHTNAQDFRKAKLPDAQTCNRCHPQQTQQFLGGKHALGWAAMAGMPITAKQIRPRDTFAQMPSECPRTRLSRIPIQIQAAQAN